MLSPETEIGMRHGPFARRFLAAEGIPVLGGSLGGKRARRLWFFPADGRVQQRLMSEESAAPIQTPVLEPPGGSGKLELFFGGLVAECWDAWCLAVLARAATGFVTANGSRGADAVGQDRDRDRHAERSIRTAVPRGRRYPSARGQPRREARAEASVLSRGRPGPVTADVRGQCGADPDPGARASRWQWRTGVVLRMAGCRNPGSLVLGCSGPSGDGISDVGRVAGRRCCQRRLRPAVRRGRSRGASSKADGARPLGAKVVRGGWCFVPPGAAGTSTGLLRATGVRGSGLRKAHDGEGLIFRRRGGSGRSGRSVRLLRPTVDERCPVHPCDGLSEPALVCRVQVFLGSWCLRADWRAGGPRRPDRVSGMLEAGREAMLRPVKAEANLLGV